MVQKGGDALRDAHAEVMERSMPKDVIFIIRNCGGSNWVSIPQKVGRAGRGDPARVGGNRGVVNPSGGAY